MVCFNLYAITARHRCTPTPLFDVISELLDAGVRAVQLREKDLDARALSQLAKPIAERCRRYDAALFINGNVKVALDVGATGVHLPVSATARANETLQLGCSIHNFDEAKKREAEGADFITYSPIYLTASKPGYGPAVGVENLKRLAKRVKIPVFALGGIAPERVAACMEAGAAGIAVMSGVMSPTGAGEEAQRYLNALSPLDILPTLR